MDEKNEKIAISSPKKWLWLGIIIALLSPISGLILGMFFWTEPELKKQAKIILIVAVIWLPLTIYLSGWLAEQGFLNI